MRKLGITLVVSLGFVTMGAQVAPVEERIWHHRNLGKAFYENPTTQIQAVDEFKKALDLAPASARERLNYGLALLRAAKTKEGAAELERAQKQDPKIPHTWWNLGIVWKKESEYDKAQAQLEQMIKLVPDEPAVHYNLAFLYKLGGKTELALKHFEISSKLNPNLAGPHFQLYNAYRGLQRTEDAARELKVFQDIKKVTAGAAVPEDMEWCWYSEILDPVDPKPQPLAAPALTFKETAWPEKVDAKSAGLAVLDLDGTGRAAVIGWSSAGVASKVGIDGGAGLKALVPGDFDNDGLADVVAVGASGATLWKNTKGRFAKSAAVLPAGSYTSAVWLDYDHDYDIDLMLLGATPVLLRNNGAAGWSKAEFPFAKGAAAGGAIYELIADTNVTDVVIAYADRAPVLYRDKLFGKYEAVPLDLMPSGATSLAIADFNNDGFMDVAAATAAKTVVAINHDGKLAVSATIEGARAPIVAADLDNRGVADLIAANGHYRNQGLGKFAAAKPMAEAVAIAALDANNDGKMDLALVAADGTVKIAENATALKSNWMIVGLTGVKNIKLAPGAEIEVKAGSLYQKRIYTGVPMSFGLGAQALADTVRITWPNGLIQNEPKQAAAKVYAYKEAQRLSGSCPMIFTWDGTKFRFITDVLGVAPLGASSGDGAYFPVDHDEYIQIPGEALKLRADGRYEIRVTEELREVSYLDHIRLIAVDHPAKTAIYTNDKFKAPPFPEFRLYGVERRIAPRSAVDHRGNDVLARVLRKDATYPDQFRRDYAGVAEKHSITLDFAGAARDNRAVLVLAGWVDWADPSTFAGVAQESKEGLIFPYLQVRNAKGEWQTVVDDLGIPAGKPKTIAVDLSGKFLSASREVRIVTNLALYWDEIFLSESTAAPETRLTPLAPAVADLRYRGFSRPVIHPARTQPEAFDYQDWMPLSMWNPTPGMYTRFGDVRPLLNSIDDTLVIMGSGDELKLEFDARALPALPSGWTRDFLLLVDGWAKDGDANTAFSQTVEPLPFHGMSQYPYPARERFPMSEAQKSSTTRPALKLVRPLSDNRGRR